MPLNSYEDDRGYGWTDSGGTSLTLDSDRLIERGDDLKLQMIDTLVSNYDTTYHTDYGQI